jgi:hypothetical protein
MALSARIYAPITGAWEPPCGGRKKKSKKMSHRIFRKYFKRETKKEIPL